MNISELRNVLGSTRINDAQISELIGIAHGLVADGHVNQSEAEYLYQWLATNRYEVDNPLVDFLFQRVKGYFEDDVLDADEAEELMETLKLFSSGKFELDELLKTTTLPLCDPAPEIVFPSRQFCFTGTFGFGARTACEAEIAKRGGQSGPLASKTNYLVIGIYANENWAETAYGRKIEKAAKMRDDGTPIHIISEPHWLNALNLKA